MPRPVQWGVQVYSTTVQCCGILDSLVVCQTLTRRVIQQILYTEKNSKVIKVQSINYVFPSYCQVNEMRMLAFVTL